MSISRLINSALAENEEKIIPKDTKSKKNIVQLSMLLQKYFDVDNMSLQDTREIIHALRKVELDFREEERKLLRKKMGR